MRSRIYFCEFCACSNAFCRLTRPIYIYIFQHKAIEYGNDIGINVLTRGMVNNGGLYGRSSTCDLISTTALFPEYYEPCYGRRETKLYLRTWVTCVDSDHPAHAQNIRAVHSVVSNDSVGDSEGPVQTVCMRSLILGFAVRICPNPRTCPKICFRPYIKSSQHLSLFFFLLFLHI